MRLRLAGSLMVLACCVVLAPFAKAQMGAAVGAEHEGSSATDTAKATSPNQIPDLSGVWMRHPLPSQRHYAGWEFTPDMPPMTPWALAKFNEARPAFGPHAVPVAQSNSPDYHCLPPGVPYIYFRPHPFEFIQGKGRVIMYFEYDHYIREIYTDGRKHPDDLDPTWMGNAIGHYENGALVVDTIGFNDRTWLDRIGHPHSDELHLIERFRRIDHDNLIDEMTIIDPKAYTKPIHVTLHFGLKPDWNIGEFICEEMLVTGHTD